MLKGHVHLCTAMSKSERYHSIRQLRLRKEPAESWIANLLRCALTSYAGSPNARSTRSASNPRLTIHGMGPPTELGSIWTAGLADMADPI